MSSAFTGCSNMVDSPTIIPDSVTDMYYTFAGCYNIVNAPNI